MGTITKALNLLNFFSTDRPDIGLTQFVKLSGSDKATVHRHLVELEKNGFLEQDAITRAYRLGPAILRLSAIKEITHPLRTVVRPIVRDLSGRLGELVHFSILQGQRLSGVYYYDPKVHGTRVSFDGSSMYPLHATASGLVFLAFATDAFVDEFLNSPLEQFSDTTITDPEQIRAITNEINEIGVSSSMGAYDSEVCSHAVPVFGPRGQLVGALSVAIPKIRYDADNVSPIFEALKEGTTRITNSIGGSFPPNQSQKWS